MAFLTIDVVLLLPESLHRAALAASALLVERMAAHDRPSSFQLGEPLPGPVGPMSRDRSGEGICEPHVSLFMLRLDPRDVDPLLAAVQSVASILPAVQAFGQRWEHNPQGAPELYFHPSEQWTRVQRAVVAVAEPLRSGLRDTDPSGGCPAEVIERLRREDPTEPRLAQLTRYGYDEITDDLAANFSPHVTVAWPSTDFQVDLRGLAPASDWNGVLAELAVFEMGRNGTCIRPFGSFPLTRPESPSDPASGGESAAEMVGFLSHVDRQER